ncbi:hypothetical protein KEH51_04465 [[Brevibacterium] frigoritolerans]|uniref:Uncharacterized protein n=1 Tax=Peribacillus frigoritolerans TaxID=450367 RepID=A0A941FIR9_9BACI|nr:hypothetical protein [Peribacillus frigoritolerans]
MGLLGYYYRTNFSICSIVDSFSSEAEAFENGAKAENRKALATAGTIILLTPISLTLIIFILVKLLLTMGLG